MNSVCANYQEGWNNTRWPLSRPQHYPPQHCNTVSLDKLTRQHKTVAGHIEDLPSGWQVSRGPVCPRLPPTLAQGQPPFRDSLPEPEQWGFPMITPLCPVPRAQPPVVSCVTNQLSPSVHWPTFITLTQEAHQTPTGLHNRPAPPLIVQPLYYLSDGQRWKEKRRQICDKIESMTALLEVENDH